MATRGQRRHLVTLANPGAATPDNEGGFTLTFANLSPATMFADIRPATARDLERSVSNTVQATASHIIEMDYHPSVNTQTRITFGAQVFQVTGVQNIDMRNEEIRLACIETVL